MSYRARLERWLHRQWGKRGTFSYLLRPLSLVVSWYIKRKSHQPRATLPFTPPPVIVVGNIIVGGAGKTPVVLALCHFLQQHGWHPGIISRGYGVSITDKEAPRVGLGQLNAAEFGDEPTLLAQQSGAPIAVHPKRVNALKALCHHYPQVDVIIADDGLQHQALSRDIEIIVQDSRGVGNGLLLPAGPLREPAQRLSQADWLITQLAGNDNLPYTFCPTEPTRCVSMRLQPSYFEQLHGNQCLSAEQWLREIYPQQRCSALAAIGQPQRFFTMLEHYGIELEQKVALADHAQLSPSSFSRLSASLLLITAKDAVKYQHLNDDRVWVVHVKPQFSPSNWLQAVHQTLQQLHKRDL